MKINSITLSDLRRMNEKESFILQGCGGEMPRNGWTASIKCSQMKYFLTTQKFENVSVFKSDGVTCIFYPFENVHLDIETGNVAVAVIYSLCRNVAVRLCGQQARRF